MSLFSSTSANRFISTIAIVTKINVSEFIIWFRRYSYFNLLGYGLTLDSETEFNFKGKASF